MAMSKPLTRTLYLLLLITWIGVCASSIYYIKAAPAETPMPVAVFTSTPVSTVAPRPTTIETIQTIPQAGETGWSLLQPGLERRLINIYDDQNQLVESVYIWRLDQKSFRLDVAFDTTPQSLESWQKETNAALVMNGGYFRIENEKYFPNGLIVLNGQASGRRRQHDAHS